MNVETLNRRSRREEQDLVAANVDAESMNLVDAVEKKGSPDRRGQEERQDPAGAAERKESPDRRELRGHKDRKDQLGRWDHVDHKDRKGQWDLPDIRKTVYLHHFWNGKF